MQGRQFTFSRCSASLSEITLHSMVYYCVYHNELHECAGVCGIRACAHSSSILSVKTSFSSTTKTLLPVILITCALFGKFYSSYLDIFIIMVRSKMSAETSCCSLGDQPMYPAFAASLSSATPPVMLCTPKFSQAGEAHTIVLMQPEGANSRTYRDYTSPTKACDSACSQPSERAWPGLLCAAAGFDDPPSPDTHIPAGTCPAAIYRHDPYI